MSGAMIAFLLSLVALVMAWMAFHRSAEIERLSARLDQLESILRALRFDREPASADERPAAGRIIEPPPPKPVPAPPPEVAVPKPQIASKPPPPSPVLPEPPASQPTLPPPPSPPRPAVLQIDWEQWIGVRGAAVV